MATGSIALEQLRGRIETSEAAGGTPTRILLTGPAGGIDASDIKKRETIEDRSLRGFRTPLVATYSGLESSMLRLTNIPISYQTIGWWLSLIAPTGGGIPGTVDSSAYTRTFTPVEDTTLNTYGTGYYSAYLEYAPQDLASTVTRQMPAMRITQMAMNFAKRASGVDTGATMDLTLEMSQGTATNGTAFTGSLSASTPTLVLGNQIATYVDTTTIGSTADTNLTTVTFNLDSPLSFHDGFDANPQHTSAHLAQQWTPTVTISRKFSDLTELNAYFNRTTRKIRVKATGDIVGATTAVNEFRLDLYGQATDHRQTEIDGLIYAEIDYELIRDSTVTTSWEVFLRNNVAAAYTAT